MASKTSILKQALLRCGQQGVNSIDDTTSPTAQVGKLIFEDTVREILRTHTWNSLMKRAVLTANAEAPLFEFAYSYTLPADFVRAVSVNGHEYNYDQPVWERVGDAIETDDSECNLKYVFYTDDVRKFDPLFQEALIVLLASKIAHRIGDGSRSGALLQEYERVLLPRAITIDCKERKRRRRPSYRGNSWYDARWTYRP
jgi:hypothetical protein